METITTYLNGSFTGYEVLAMALAASWLAFNLGFVGGAAWKGMFSTPKRSDDYAIQDDHRLADVARRARC